MFFLGTSAPPEFTGGFESHKDVGGFQPIPDSLFMSSKEDFFVCPELNLQALVTLGKHHKKILDRFKY